MAQFKVGCNEIQYGSKIFEAETEEDALIKAKKYLEENGLDDTFDVFDREYGAEFANNIGEPEVI